MAEIYSSLYKGKVHVTTPFKPSHQAIDLGNYKTRNPIYSPNKLGNGTVSYIATSYRDSTGKLWDNSLSVYIKYDNGFISRHFHGQVNDQVVKKGDRVKPGQQVYRTGNTGASQGDHLHYVLIDAKGNRVDPVKYVLNDEIPQEPVPTPEPTECEKRVKMLEGENTQLTEALGSLQEGLKKSTEELKLLNERTEFLEGTLAVRETEMSDLEATNTRVLEERNRFEAQYIDVVTELNELKEGRDSWIQRLADVLHKLFGMK